MGNFLTLDFWFNLRPGVFTSLSFRIISGLVILSVILAIFAAIGKKRWAKGLYAALWNGLYYFFLINVIVGSILMFFNYEMVHFLSARFWFLLWGASLVGWLVFIGKIIFRIPQKRARLEKEKEFKKYLP